MSLQSYLLFVGASIVLCIVPGPDMAYLLSRCVAQGRRAGFMAALGFNAGGYVHLLGAMLGLSALLATSSFTFTLVRWIGAGYLIYLGVQALVTKSEHPVLRPNALTARSARAIFWQAFVSDVLNPKVALFFLALLPQFVVAQGFHPALQMLILGMTVNIIALIVNILLVYLATRVTEALRRNESIAFWLHKAMGAVFVGLGLRLASEKG